MEFHYVRSFSAILPVPRFSIYSHSTEFDCMNVLRKWTDGNIQFHAIFQLIIMIISLSSSHYAAMNQKFFGKVGFFAGKYFSVSHSISFRFLSFSLSLLFSVGSVFPLSLFFIPIRCGFLTQIYLFRIGTKDFIFPMFVCII